MTKDHLFSRQPAWPSTAVSSLLSAFVVLVLGLALCWALCRLDTDSATASDRRPPAAPAFSDGQAVPGPDQPRLPSALPD